MNPSVNPNLNRRDFLRTGTIGGISVAAGLASTAKVNARTPGANDRIRVAIVGFADRFKTSLGPSFNGLAKQHNVEFCAVSDLWSVRRDEAVAWAKSTAGVDIQAYRNNEELYEKGKPDAVIIATADFQHALHLAEAVEAGCDVYCEKPFAETMEDARHALKVAKASDRVIQIGSQRRSGSSYHAAYEYLKSGAFGDIVCAEMCWNVNQPGRWRRPELVASIRKEDTDWDRFLMNRPKEDWDPRKYLEYRLFWPYSSGITGQWMCHQIDTVHWFTGLPYPRSVSANGGIYLWRDGRSSFDTLTAVFDYGPLEDLTKGFQVVYTSRFTNSAGGTKEIYYSNAGELNLDTRRVTPNGGLIKADAAVMKMPANLLKPTELKGTAAVTSAVTGSDPLTTSHVLNWLECLRSRKPTNAPVEAGYQHAIACIMANAAARTGMKATFDPATQDVMVGGKVFHI
jgi:predicted dehydrogenase